MPRVWIYGNSEEGLRTRFLREILRHVPEVLRDLRDHVLPVHRAVVHYQAEGLDAEAGNGVHALADVMAEWRAQYHLNLGVAADHDWIAERSEKTLEDWERRSHESLHAREELLEQDRDSLAELMARWRAAEGDERRSARIALRRAIQLVRQHRRLPLSRSPLAYRWWAPDHAERRPPLGVDTLAKTMADALHFSDWSVEGERELRKSFDDLVAEWKLKPNRVGKEMAHLRWLALWQCANLSYAEIGRYEQDFSSATLEEMAIALSEGSGARAFAILLDRGEPWIKHLNSGVLVSLPVDSLDASRVLRGYKVTRPARNSIEEGIRDAADQIGLLLRIGRPGRRRQHR